MCCACVEKRHECLQLLSSKGFRCLWLKPLSVQGSGSGTPRKVVSTRKTSGPKRVVGGPPWPSFSFASILSSSPPFRLVLDCIQFFQLYQSFPARHHLGWSWIGFKFSILIINQTCSPPFSLSLILSSSPPVRLVLDWIFISLLLILNPSNSPPFSLVLDWIFFRLLCSLQILSSSPPFRLVLDWTFIIRIIALISFSNFFIQIFFHISLSTPFSHLSPFQIATI